MRGGARAYVVACLAASWLACDAQGAAPDKGDEGEVATPDARVDAAPSVDGVGPGPDVDAGPDASADVAPAPILPGRVVWRRLNRTEYRNTLRDLLGTSLDPGKDLPSDDLGYGFDNIASVLTMSPLHLELYERSARVLADELTRPPITQTLRFSVEAEDLTIAGEYGSAMNDGFMLWSVGALAGTFDLPADGAWRFEMRAWETPAGDEAAKLALWVDGAMVHVFDLTATPAEYTLEVTLSKGRHAIEVEFINDFYEAPADRNALIDRFGLSGPLTLDVYEDTAWGRHVACRPEVIEVGGTAARACAEATVSALLPRAWRRPALASDTAALMALYDGAVADGAPALEALALPLQAVLLSPRFLFKVELDREGGALDGWEIATRLSYFLWSTMPDAALMEAAASGKLAEVEGIAAEVRRMLEDPRAEALVQNFAGQWLYVRDVDNAIPDPWVFPEFDDALRHAMAEEMRMFFRSFVTGDRSMIELLTATDTWVNRRLAEHYGLEDGAPAADDVWVRMTIDGVGRRGVLTQAGLLTALSTPFRTSIVRRGKWVLGQLLCAEPSPPPPGVEGLIEVQTPGEAPKTLREKMELHKTEERCKTCHKAMDAIGFGLEGFDGIGMARTSDNGFPIDDSGELRGQAFEGAIELAGIIAEDPRLPACMVEKVMIYALGRGLGGEDQPLIDRLIADFAARGHRFSALVELVATSEAFRMREVER